MIYIRKITLDRIGFLRSGSYAAELPFIKSFDSLEFDSPVTFITGENGSGKSTLIEGIAVAAGFNPEGGSRNFSFGTRESHSALCDYITVVRGTSRPSDGFFLRAESFYNVATNIEQLDSLPAASRKITESYGGRSLHEQSHGESFLSLMQNRFGGRGIYILDEPEAALSAGGLLKMLAIMRRLADEASQFIISTHSPILTAYPGSSIYEINESGIHRTEWKKTESYIITKRFLSDPDMFFDNL